MPAAYGDLAAAALAGVALAFGRRPGMRAALWVFNVWGTADLLFTFYQGILHLGISASSLGAAIWIVLVFVPLLVCTHTTLFVLLLKHRGG